MVKITTERAKASKRFWLYIKIMFGWFALACVKAATGAHWYSTAGAVVAMIGCGVGAYAQGKREGSIR